jgi:hypothetical protein
MQTLHHEVNLVVILVGAFKPRSRERATHDGHCVDFGADVLQTATPLLVILALEAPLWEGLAC